MPERNPNGKSLHKNALAYLEVHDVNGEVIVADNGSTDGCGVIASSLVVLVSRKGYGSDGFQSMLFWVFAQMLEIQRGLLLSDVSFERVRRAMPLERGLALGMAFILMGMLTFVAAVFQWSAVGFGQLTQGTAIRSAVVSGATLVLGTQILYGSFFTFSSTGPGGNRLHALRWPAPPITRFSRSTNVLEIGFQCRVLVLYFAGGA
jgi:hypothetical protein